METRIFSILAHHTALLVRRLLPFAFRFSGFANGFEFGFFLAGFFEPCFPLVRCFEGDSADFAFAEVGEDVLGGFLVVDPSAAEDCAAFFGYPFEP